MTTSVDVLAVMDIAATSIEQSGGNVAYMRQARAAVAELIAADTAYDKAYADAVADPANEAALAEAEERRATALARVKGGAA